MGDAADDAYDAALAEEAMHRRVFLSLREQGCRCPDDTIVGINDDGLYECSGCNRTADW